MDIWISYAAFDMFDIYIRLRLWPFGQGMGLCNHFFYVDIWTHL